MILNSRIGSCVIGCGIPSATPLVATRISFSASTDPLFEVSGHGFRGDASISATFSALHRLANTDRHQIAGPPPRARRYVHWISSQRPPKWRPPIKREYGVLMTHQTPIDQHRRQLDHPFQCLPICLHGGAQALVQSYFHCPYLSQDFLYCSLCGPD